MEPRCQKVLPATWNYQGLANTLSAMERYGEANAAYQKLINIDSTSARYWQNWAHSRSYAGDYEDCIEKCKQSAKADPTYVGAYRTWAWVLHQQEKL